MRQDLPKVLDALNKPLLDTYKIINKIDDNCELITNTPSIINPIQVFPKNSNVEIKEFDQCFQDTYIGTPLNGGGTSCIYTLKSDPSKIIRISNGHGKYADISMGVNDWLQEKLIYKKTCNLSAFKNKYPELPVAQIDDVFFIHAQKVIRTGQFGNKDSVGPIPIKGNPDIRDTDFYHMATIMEKLVDEHFKLDNAAVINAKTVLNNLKITIGDFKERNIVKKICKEPYTDKLKLHADTMCSKYTVENDYISYEVPIFIDYDDWTVPTVGENVSDASVFKDRESGIKGQKLV